MKMEKAFSIPRLIEDILGFIAIFTIVIETYAVFCRSILNISTAWTDEVLRICFIWLIFISAAVAYKSGGLIGLDLLEDKLMNHMRLRQSLKILQSVLVLIYGLFTCQASFNIVSTQLNSGEATPIMALPLWFVNLGFLIGSILFIIYGAYHIFRYTRAMITAGNEGGTVQ